MTAHMIITAHVTDREAFMAGYAPAAAKLVEQHGGEYVIRGPGAKQMEGAGWNGASVAVSRWPDRAAAEAFWNSDEYAEVKKLREGIAEVSVLLIGD